MRTRPIFGTKVWFAPRGFGGWGWAPVSWEGWAALILTVVSSLAMGSRGGWWGAPGIVALLLACILKGTTPGGPKRREEFLRSRAREGLVRGAGDDTPSIEGINRRLSSLDDI